MTMRTNLDIDVLRTFILGFDLGSFARAAERIGRSQSAVSAQLRKLEEQIGQPLVTRAGRGLALTDAGEELLSYARRIVELNDQAIEAVRGADLQGWVRLGLPQDVAEAWLPELLTRFAQSHPDIRVEVRAEKVSTLVEKTLLGELDLTLAWGAQPGARFVDHVADVPMVWVGRDRGEQHVADDHPLSLVAFEPPCAFRDLAVAALDGAGVAWRVAFSSPSLTSLWAAVGAGRGLTARTKVGLPPQLCVMEGRRCGLPDLPGVSLQLVRAEREAKAVVQFMADLLLDVVRNRLADVKTSPAASLSMVA